MFNNLGDWLGQKIAPYITDALGMRDFTLANYYSGDHRRQLKTRIGQPDDNIILNFVGLAVNRSVSRLFRGGVKWELPEGGNQQQEYLDKVWDLNKKEIILYQVGLHGAVYGTTYFKVSPEGLTDPYTNELYPRLIALDPEIIRIKTAPQDMNEVQLYTISYKIRETAYWEITVRNDVEYGFDSNGNIITRSRVEETDQLEEVTVWVIDEYEQVGGGPRVKTDTKTWDYPFPPIIHWKNLPSLKSCYGYSDIEDAINVQDKTNFVVSNTGKIIKHHAHPKTIGTGFHVKDMQPLPDSPDEMWAIPSGGGGVEPKVYNLELSSDLASSRAFALDLRQAVFDIVREVDITSMADKLGALTNFGLQVLWSDAIDKNDTKRQLYGDALKELNRRLLVLAGNEGEASNPGDIQWGKALPVNLTEEITFDKIALELGIIDKETVANLYQSRYGVDWETIQANLDAQSEKDNQQNADVGALILRNFNQGKGMNEQIPAAMRGNKGQQAESEKK